LTRKLKAQKLVRDKRKRMAKQVKKLEPRTLPIVIQDNGGLERLTEQSMATLREVATDQDAPASARTSAARSLAEIAGLIGRQKPKANTNQRPTAELSLDEIDREIAALTALDQPEQRSKSEPAVASDARPKRVSPG